MYRINNSRGVNRNKKLTRIKNVIICDGHTEKIYFKKIKDYYENKADLNSSSSRVVVLYKTKENRSGLKNLIKTAETKIDEFEFENLYCVMDSEFSEECSVNDKKNIDEDREKFCKFKKDTEKNIYLIMNSPCFEYFLCLFWIEKTTTKDKFSKCDDCISYIKKSKSNYNKTNIDVFLKDEDIKKGMKNLFNGFDAKNLKKKLEEKLDILKKDNNGKFVKCREDIIKFTNVDSMIYKIWEEDILKMLVY
jgi:hypothetical protein